MRETVVYASFWTAFMVGMLRLPAGVLVFTVLVVSQMTFLALIAAPWYYDRGVIKLGGEAVLSSPSVQF